MCHSVALQACEQPRASLRSELPRAQPAREPIGVMPARPLRHRAAQRFGTGEVASSPQESLYQTSFSQLTRGQFKRLMGLATVETLPPGQTLTAERASCDSLFFVLEGFAKMTLDGEYVTLIEAGGFCNTLAFQRGGGEGRASWVAGGWGGHGWAGCRRVGRRWVGRW